MRETGEVLDDWEAAKYIACLHQRIADLEGEFSRRAISADDYRRADQNCVCPDCNKLYIDHPYGGPIVYDRSMILHRLCSGDLVKL